MTTALISCSWLSFMPAFDSSHTTSIALLVMAATLIICTRISLFLYNHLPRIKKTLSSLSISTSFLWHGPHAFLKFRDKLAGAGAETFSLGGNNLVVLNLDIIKHCLVLRASNYDKGGRAARLMGDVVGPYGILGALDEEDHVPSHQVLNPHTKRPERIQAFEDLVLQETDRMLEEWGQSTQERPHQVDLYRDLNEVFFKVLYKFAFGIELSRKRFQHVHHLISKLERYSAVVGFVPAKLLPMYKLLRRDVVNLVTALNKEVLEIIEQVGEGSPLSELQDPLARINDTQLRDTVKNLLFAGATTAANALGWAVHCVAREERCAEKAKEAAKVEDINFFKNVCLETNRMYPQANVITRRAKEEDKVEGYGAIPKDRVLVIPIIALHHHPLYYPQPHTFNPDRWANKRPPPLMSYIPFTAGPRQCIGQNLFNRAGPLVLMHMFDHFSFAPMDLKAKPKWPNAVLPPTTGGFKMIIRRA